MKISIITVLVTLITVTSISVFADETIFGGPRNSAVAEMEKYDIVRNPFEKWREHDYITRRDALKITYIMKNISRDSYIDSLEWAQNALNNYTSNPMRKQKFEFVDLSDDDYLFAVVMFVNGLLYGREENGFLYADLDGYVTYNEACAYVFRVFTKQYMPDEAVFVDNISFTSYYDFCNDANLLNSRNAFEICSIYDLDDQVLIVAEDQLGDKIEAYDFLLLMHKALYLPYPSEETSYNMHLIDYFSKYKIENKKMDRDNFISD